MDVGLFDYDLPPELIAQEPAEPRDASRLLALERATGRIDDRRFSDLEGLLRPGDCLVANHTRVIPARVLGIGEGGRPVELLFLRPVDGERWEAMVRPGRRCRVGARIEVAGGAARARVVGEGREGTRVIAIEAPWPVPELLERHGLPPLPPYIGRHAAPKPEDRERYQTVYARAPPRRRRRPARPPPGGPRAPRAGGRPRPRVCTSRPSCWRGSSAAASRSTT